jgi:hypothetical protein
MLAPGAASSMMGLSHVATFDATLPGRVLVTMSAILLIFMGMVLVRVLLSWIQGLQAHHSNFYSWI